MFEANIYLKRRNTLKSRLDSGIILLMGNDESPINYMDNPYWFRQDSTFLYFFGLNNPGLIGIIDVDGGQDYIFGDDPTIEDTIWMGHQDGLSNLAKKTGVENTGHISGLEKLLKKSIAKGRIIHRLPPYRAEHKIKLYNWMNIDPNKSTEVSSVDLIKAVVAQREIKSDEELIEIENAVNTTVDMHIKAMQIVRPGLLESDIVSEVEKIATKSGGNTSFPTIATKHGEILHNHFHGNQLQEGDMFLLDCGAETAMGYAGDLSSTIPVGTSFTQQQRDIYNITLSSHNTSIEMLKPGAPFIEIYFSACRIIVDGLKDLGLMKGDTNTAVEVGAHALFFPCGLGHQMGLDIHDMENLGEKYVGYDGKPKSKQFGLKSLRLAKPLVKGMVLTIEPGIYFIPALINMWNAEKRFFDFINYEKLKAFIGFGGIRNEENFVITNDGYELIGKNKPKTIEDVEKQKIRD